MHQATVSAGLPSLEASIAALNKAMKTTND